MKKKKTSYRGHPYWVWRKPMPRIDDILLSCVFYIYPSTLDAIDGTELGGSGFFYKVQSEAFSDRGYLYAVTNAHCVFGENKPAPVLRINTIDGKFDVIETCLQDWVQHQDGDDLACHLIELDPLKHEYGYFDKEHLITRDFIKQENIGPGDDVIMTGRFRSFSGSKKNLPTTRFGNISTMPNEPLKNHLTGIKQESFLVEMRSISGYSGSPVMVVISPMSMRHRKGSESKLSLDSKQRLLGIDWGHIPYKEPVLNQDGNKHSDKLHVKLSSSMSAVVPAWKLLELIESEEVSKTR